MENGKGDAMHGRRRRGFTLIELLVSAVILSVGLVGLSQLYMGAMWTYKKGRNLSVATQRAQLEMEKVRNLGFDGLINGINTSSPDQEDAYLPEYYTYLSSRMGVQFTVGNLPNGRGTLTWQPYPIGTELKKAKMLQITLDISWDGSTREQSRVHLISFAAQGYK